MKQNLNTLKTEIQEYLESHGFAVFHGYAPNDDEKTTYWDCVRRPDYREFLQAAEAAGARLIVFHEQEFLAEILDDSIERLKDSDLDSGEQRDLERRLEEMRIYDGMVGMLELSFDLHGRLYIFDLRTDWYEEISDMLDDIDANRPADEDDGPIGSYFSNN